MNIVERIKAKRRIIVWMQTNNRSIKYWRQQHETKLNELCSTGIGDRYGCGYAQGALFELKAKRYLFHDIYKNLK